MTPIASRLLPLSAMLAALAPLVQAASAPLPALSANVSRTSVSGISSGGFMAAQLATAFSSRFMGVGVIAAGPYYCAGTHPALSFLKNAMTTCMTPASAAAGADGAISWKNAQLFASKSWIDPVSHLKRQRVYIFSGSQDQTVVTKVVDQVQAYYLLAGVPAAQIRYRTDGAGHSIITNRDGDVACGATASPFINNCGFMQSQELLRHIYGDASKPPSGGAPSGELLKFDQHAFVKGSRSSMDTDAYVYVPTYCRHNSCAVHVAFHGCQQGARQIGDHFYRRTGYNEFADANHMIVLYPQAVASKGIPPNPKGCWDFWGYSSEDQRQPTFFTRQSPQMRAVIGMIDRLAEKK